MSAAKVQQKLYTVPAGIPFAKALAAKLLKDTAGVPERLSLLRVFLPTRRACAVLKDSFLQKSGGRPLLLPRLQPLGDIDEEELSVSLAGARGLEIPPALPALKRQILLARLIEKLPGFTRGFDQDLALAAALGRLMDQVYTENLSLAGLHRLAPAAFSDHWQITITFLEILSVEWPKILATEGCIDGADRRNRLIVALAEFWREHKPEFPVIAAGSTGSIPATAELLKTIACLPQGAVILPGLDRDMDPESWDALEETHPQYGLKHLLEHLRAERWQVAVWPGEDQPIPSARRALAREVMRPAATVQAWANIGTNAAVQNTLGASLANLRSYEAPDERAEAEIIAALMREALETPGRTAALITPDRELARRVAAACGRWGITVDDSGGQTLDQTPLGCFLRLCVQAAAERFAPVSLLSLLKHDLCACGMELSDLNPAIQILEKTLLRGLRPSPGFSGLFDRLSESGSTKVVSSAPSSDALLRFIAPILQRFNPASESDKPLLFHELMVTHLAVAEQLAARPDRDGASVLWAGEVGEKVSLLFAEMMEHGRDIGPLSLPAYQAALETFLKTVTVRPAYGTHPRLAILGQLEARLIDADLLILGGLNEGSWPQEAGHDPWMSRPMRRDFGLPAPERGTGLSAHDFVQGFCAPDVALTRAARSDGAPAVPSRWLQRLDTVLKAAHLALPAKAALLSWIRAADYPPEITPCARPAPRPPQEKRPQRLSATRIETWLKDPYQIYAQYILRLKKLEPLEKEPGAAERGQLLHKILQQFVTACPGPLPPEARDILYQYARAELDRLREDPAVWSFWWPRFTKISAWLIEYETGWRRLARPVLTELKGAMQVPGTSFIAEARPDRIDLLAEGAAVIDYKSGGSFSKKSIETGDRPQLAIEGLIYASGGFPTLKKGPVSRLSYWVLSGDPGVTEVTGPIDAILQRTENGLKNLVTAFDNSATPYYSLPRPDDAPAFNDYEHLARVREWSAAGSDSESEAA